jgi:hypothetical protein
MVKLQRVTYQLTEDAMSDLDKALQVNVNMDKLHEALKKEWDQLTRSTYHVAVDGEWKHFSLSAWEGCRPINGEDHRP